MPLALVANVCSEDHGPPATPGAPLIVRCFVAIDLSPAIREAVARAQANLHHAARRADVRWVDPSGCHVTLKFLGEVAEANVEAVERALACVIAGHPALTLDVERLGGFPSVRRPRVVWAGLTGNLEQLGRLAGAIETSLAPLGFPPETRPLRGHITLARVRSPHGLGRLVRALEVAAGTQLGRWTVHEVVLYRSHLRPTGAVYEPLARFALGRA